MSENLLDDNDPPLMKLKSLGTAKLVMTPTRIAAARQMAEALRELMEHPYDSEGRNLRATDKAREALAAWSAAEKETGEPAQGVPMALERLISNCEEVFCIDDRWMIDAARKALVTLPQAQAGTLTDSGKVVHEKMSQLLAEVPSSEWKTK